MSDTPRTDAEFTDDYYVSGYVPTEFAQQLERALAAAESRLKDAEIECGRQTLESFRLARLHEESEARLKAAEAEAKKWKAEADKQFQYAEELVNELFAVETKLRELEGK